MDMTKSLLCQLITASIFLVQTSSLLAAPAIDPVFEAYEGNSKELEAALTSDLVDKFRLLQMAMAAKTGQLLRDTHSKGTCLEGSFKFYHRNEGFLKVGPFGIDKTIDVPNIRFADANSGLQPNNIPDVRSVSFSLFTGDTRQDFSMNNDPTFTFGNLTDFNNFLAFGIMNRQFERPIQTAKFLAKNPDIAKSVAKTAFIGKIQQNKDVFSYLTENYGSGAAFKFGHNQAAKFILVRCATDGKEDSKEGVNSCTGPGPKREKPPVAGKEDYLITRLKESVISSPSDFCFELKVQILDAENMRDQMGRKHSTKEWVENAVLDWNGPRASSKFAGKCYSLGKLSAKQNSIKNPDQCDSVKEAFDVNGNSYAEFKPLGNINRARQYAEVQSAKLRNPDVQITPEPSSPVSKTQFISQGWDETARDSFWYTPQGSYIVPYAWFLALKDPRDSSKLMKDTLAEDGFIDVAYSSALNPDKLPIGITKEAEPVANFPHLKGKGPWLGVTCAACHVGAVAVNGTRYILDGAPAKTDFQTFSIKIENGLANLLKDDLSFAQFKKAVGKEVRKADIQDVYNRLSARNTRSFYHKTERESGPINAGPGRSDAFAIILNEVDSRALGVKENSKEGTAPVSFPQLWTAPYLKWIQYSGLSNNAFTRNIGEVLGVFGDVNLDPQSPDFLATTARVDKVQVLEQHLRSLKAPKWESVFGKFTATEREQIARGAATYRGHCAQCHLPEQSHKLGEFQSVSLIPAVEFGADYTRNKVFAGTDPLYFINLKRNWVSIDPGPLKGTSVIAEMIKHNPTLLGKLRFPDDQMVGGILKRGKDGQKYLDGLAKEKPFGASTNGVIVLAQTTLGIALKYMGDNNIKMDQQDPAYQSLTGGALPEIQPVVGAFKARSLEGIWATAPYLHSGSVRSLRDLLSPPSERESEFYVGGDEYDVKNVGFRSSGKFLFRSNKLGNGSSGHYSFLKVSELDESAKEDLLMYLKSI